MTRYKEEGGSGDKWSCGTKLSCVSKIQKDPNGDGGSSSLKSFVNFRHEEGRQIRNGEGGVRHREKERKNPF